MIKFSNYKMKKEKRIENLTNREVRAFWETKKSKMRWKMSLFFAIIAVVGLEIATIEYSLSTIIIENVISKVSIIHEVTSNLEIINKKFLFFDTDIIPLLKKSTKLLIAVMLASFWYYFLINKDPLCNYELLRTINYNSKRRKNPIHKEVSFYAKYLPSNIIATICDGCGYKDGCQQRVPMDGDRKTGVWFKIFATLDSKDAYQWLKVTNDCRQALYWKYGLLFSALILSLIYIILFISSLLNPQLRPSETIFILIGICLVGYFFVGFVNRTEKDQGGAWRNFREHSISFFQSEKYADIQSEKLCYKATTEKDLKSLRMMNNYISYIIEDKLLKHCCGYSEKSKNNKAHIRRILQHAKAYYYVLYDKKIKFRTALFLLSQDQRYLFPFILDDTNFSRFYCLDNSNKVHEICADFFAIEKDSVASKAWRTREPISQSQNIATVRDIESDHLQSILCFPLRFNSDVYEYLINQDESFHQFYGVLCIDADSKKVFNNKNYNINIELVKAFADRITYEISLGLYYSYKERGKETNGKRGVELF